MRTGRTRRRGSSRSTGRARKGCSSRTELIYGGLIVLGVYLVQPFVTGPSLNVTATIRVVAFSLSLPLLAFLLMVYRLGSLYHQVPCTWYVSVAKCLAVTSACVGVVAAFWHMAWFAGVVVVVGGVLGLAVHSAYYSRLARDVGFGWAEQGKSKEDPSATLRHRNDAGGTTRRGSMDVGVALTRFRGQPREREGGSHGRPCPPGGPGWSLCDAFHSCRRCDIKRLH